MKIKIELCEELDESEVTIKCKELNDEVKQLQNAIQEVSKNNQVLSMYKNEVEYFISIDKIIFFETQDNGLCAQTIDDVFQSKYKLYELETILPNYFIRVSKSTILNVNEVFSIDRNLTSSSLVSFANTHKQVYVSRFYYKNLKIKLDEKRIK